MKIAVSGLNNTDNPAPGIGVAKSLKNYKLIGFSYDVNEPGIYQGLFEKVYLMPFPTVGWEDTKKRLVEIKEKDGLDIIIPNLDSELPMYIKHQKEIQELGIKVLLPTMKEFEKRDKKNLFEFCKEIDIKYPETYIINSIDELIKILNTIGFPVMIKGNYYKAYKVHNFNEAIKYFYEISNEWGFPILVQKIVYGEEINYVGLAHNGKLMGGVGMKKLTTTHLGKVWNAISIKNEKLFSLVEEFIKKTNWNGPFEIEAIMNQNEIFLIEVNPRFPAWVNFSTMLGINLPEMLIKILNNEKIEPKLDYPSEKLYIRYIEETTVDFNRLSKLLNKKEI